MLSRGISISVSMFIRRMVDPVFILQNTIIQMEPVETQPYGFIKEFKCAHLSGPGQFKISLGLANTMQIKAIRV